MGEEFPGAPDAGLDLVEDEKEPVLVAELPQRTQAARRDRADAALALDRFDHDGRGLGRDRLQRLVVVEGDLIEALDLGAEALEIFLLAAGRDGRERASVERALEGDDAEAVRLSVRRMVLAPILMAASFASAPEFERTRRRRTCGRRAAERGARPRGSRRGWTCARASAPAR